MLGRAVRLLRLYLPLLLGLLTLGALAGFAWLTAHPETPVLEEAERWPWVGSLASTFRERYLGPPLPVAESHPQPGPGVAEGPRRPSAPGSPEVVYRVPEVLDARVMEWVLRGTTLHSEPRPGAPVVAEVDAIANLPVLERRGEWALLRWRDTSGWASLPSAPEGGAPSLGSAPEPVLPRPEQPPDPARLARALELLGPGVREHRVGPYRLHTDSGDASLLLLLDRAAGQLEAAYRERYGLEPVGEPRAEVVLYSDPGAYRAFAAPELTGAPDTLTGHVFQGLVALSRGARAPAEVRATLVHELVHLLNRRALGPALPPWLDEGLANDLAESAFDGQGRPLPGALGHSVSRHGTSVEVQGGVAALHLLVGEDRPALVPLSRLLDLSHEEFLRGDERSRHYAQASFFVRFLLAGDHAEPFRGFLADLARGGPVEPQALSAKLGRSWKELEGDFARWLVELAAATPLPTPT